MEEQDGSSLPQRDATTSPGESHHIKYQRVFGLEGGRMHWNKTLQPPLEGPSGLLALLPWLLGTLTATHFGKSCAVQNVIALLRGEALPFSPALPHSGLSALVPPAWLVWERFEVTHSHTSSCHSNTAPGAAPACRGGSLPKGDSGTAAAASPHLGKQHLNTISNWCHMNNPSIC